MVQKREFGDFEEETTGSPRVSDWVKKTIMTGVGAMFMTEEGIRNALGEMRLPKNVITSVVLQAEKTKHDVLVMVGKEVRSFMEGIELDKLIKKALAGQAIEITATIRFKNDDQAAKSTVTKTSKKR